MSPKVTSVLPWCLLVVLCLVGSVTPMSVQEYFPEIGNDLTTVTWAHAVNSRDELHGAFEGKIMMLEADVVLGTLDGGSGDLMPIMAHPPDTTSDLSLSDFLSAVVAATKSGHRCGIKLDFKSLQVLSPSLRELQLYEKMIKFPVMLNADILPGPLNSTTTPVDANTFLQQCSKRFPMSTLSVGWTTRYGGLIFNASYSQHEVEEMSATLERNEISQSVTFPVRAGIAAKSADTLTWLKNNVTNSTFTIWSSESDPVDVELLRSVILDALGTDRVYVDVPESLSNQLQLSSTRTSSAPPSSLSSIMAIVVSMVTGFLYKFK